MNVYRERKRDIDTDRDTHRNEIAQHNSNEHKTRMERNGKQKYKNKSKEHSFVRSYICQMNYSSLIAWNYTWTALFNHRIRRK